MNKGENRRLRQPPEGATYEWFLFILVKSFFVLTSNAKSRFYFPKKEHIPLSNNDVHTFVPVSINE